MTDETPEPRQPPLVRAAETLREFAYDLRDSHCVPGTGHWPAAAQDEQEQYCELLDLAAELEMVHGMVTGAQDALGIPE